MSEVLKRRMRCAVYTRKSTDEGLDQEYNSIDAQRDAGHAGDPRRQEGADRLRAALRPGGALPRVRQGARHPPRRRLLKIAPEHTESGPSTR